MRCSYPLVVSEPISQGNLVGYQRCGGTYLLHHTDPASLVHQSTRFHRSHQHWHPWNKIWVDSILPVPVSFLPASISYACGLHWTCWLSSESAPPGHSGEEGGDPHPPPPPPGVGLALVCHLHGLATLTLGVSSSTTPS